MSALRAAGHTVRTRIRVEGTVQGVGFRPFVHRLAHELGLGGFVLNDSRGVLIEAEGTASAVRELRARLASGVPPPARVERVRVASLRPTGEREFRIAPSPAGAAADVPVAPDSATCPDCLRELFDPSDRRFRYPFINCTTCGPRFTIVRGVPYDRPLTSMAGFQMCRTCRAEYENPLDRRFHAQPNACPACGPQVSLVDAAGRARGRREQALAEAAEALRAGAIVAVKGLGGYHLACLAADEATVAALRARKHREEKPFAVMARDLPAVLGLVDLGPEDERALLAPARPIVVAPRRPGVPIASAVAPGSADLGVMLPYSPLHHLLLHDVGGTLVMTSANLSDEPIAYRDQDALERLGGVADLFLVHDRPIETRTDDSVLRSTGRRRGPLVIRRSRGYVPAALELPVAAPRPLLACGGELKSTFCVAKGRRAWISHHIGDLERYETLRSFTEGVEHFERLFAVAPGVLVHDLHPEYLSTKYAREAEDVELLGVQHHHAHLAACMAEHGEQASVVGAIYDGTGYGTDGTLWGGELLVGGLEGFERAGHLWPVRLPGGVRAVREPWRMACAWLVALHGREVPAPAALAAAVDPQRWHAVSELALTGMASPVTTGMGRLFDAVAALCGIRTGVNYEGQAAVELEGACDPAERGSYQLPLADDGGRIVMDARETVAAVAHDVGAGTPVPAIAARFHNAIARTTSEACIELAGERGLDAVALSGGSFQNRRLLGAVREQLTDAGLRVLIPERLPPNDGGISYGQAAIAAAILPG